MSLCVGCSGVYMLMAAAFLPTMQAAQQGMQQQVEKERQSKINKLKAEEDKAETPAEQDQLKAEREQLENAPSAKMPDMSKLYGFNDRRVTGYFAIDFGTALVLNVMLLISGIGLLGLKPWARRLGIYTSIAKIARLVVLYTGYIVVIMPIQVAAMTEMIAEMSRIQPRGPQGPPPQQMGTMMGLGMTMYAVVFVLLAIIYPAISWYLLCRPSVKAACVDPGTYDPRVT